MNVSTVHITVTRKRLVLTQTEAIVVFVKQDSLGMVQCAQVCNKCMASNAMRCIQTIFCFSVREPDTALSPLAILFECVQISVFCYIFVIVDRSKANTWTCLRGKHLTSNTLKTWRDLATTSAALGRLFDARLVRPPLQAHTKAVQLAKKGQINKVLPSCKWNKTSMLRLQTVVQSTLFPKIKSPRQDRLSKPPQRASKLASFDTVFGVRTLAVTFFFVRRTCSCRLSASLSSHLTPDHAGAKQHRPSTQQKAFRQPSRWRGSTACSGRIDRVSDHCMRWYMVCASSIPLVELRIRLSNSYSSGLEFE